MKYERYFFSLLILIHTLICSNEIVLKNSDVMPNNGYHDMRFVGTCWSLRVDV